MNHNAVNATPNTKYLQNHFYQIRKPRKRNL